jgi:L-cysteine/cystine lyase
VTIDETTPRRASRGPRPAIEAIRAMLPGVHDTVYLNTGTCGPMPRHVFEAWEREARLDLTKARIDGNHFPHIADMRSRVRQSIAHAIGAAPSEVAVTSSTTDGMYVAIMGYRWQPGDELLLTNLEHPGGLIPSFIAKRRFGVRLRVVDLGLGGGGPVEIVARLERAFSARTRMLVLSHVSYTTGARLPLKEIVAAAHARDVLVVADAAQSYGALALDMHDLGVDAYAFAGQKWMLGPDGTGGLYVSATSVGEFEQTFVAGGTIRETLDYLGGSIAPAAGAQRFDTAGRNTALLAAQHAATDWIVNDLGMEWVAGRVEELAARTYDALAALPGVTLVTPREALAGLIAFTVEGIAPPELTRRIADEHNVTIRFVGRYINNPDAARVSVGFFNTAEDIARLVEGIQAIQRALA